MAATLLTTAPVMDLTPTDLESIIDRRLGGCPDPGPALARNRRRSGR
jgi:hypothetical protein